MFLKLYANSGCGPETQLCWQEELGLDDRWSWRQCAEEPLTSSRPMPLCVHFLLTLILLLASSSLMPNLSPQQAHSLVYRPSSPPPPPPLVHDASPSILFMSPLRPNWWVNTNKLPSLHLSIVSWSWRASLPLSRAAHLLILLPHPPLPLLCSLFIKFPFGSGESKSMAEFIGRLNSWPKGTWAMWLCVCGKEGGGERGRQRVTDWQAD